MLNSAIDDIRREKAVFIRDTEYLKETALDDMVDERMDAVESVFERETVEDLMEAAEMVKKLSGEEDVTTESAEVEKILNAKEDISFEEVIGI